MAQRRQTATLDRASKAGSTVLSCTGPQRSKWRDREPSGNRLLLVNGRFHLLHNLGRDRFHTVLCSSVFGDLSHYLIFVFTTSDKATIHSSGAAFHYFCHSSSPQAWIVTRFALARQEPFDRLKSLRSSKHSVRSGPGVDPY